MSSVHFLLWRALTHRAGASIVRLCAFFFLIAFFVFHFYQVKFFSPLSNRFEIRGRAVLGPTLNKLSGSETVVWKEDKRNSKCLLGNINTKSKNNQTKLPPPLSVFVVLAALPSIKGWGRQDTCRGVQVPLERDGRRVHNYYSNHNATAEWELYVKCTLGRAMRWAGEEVCDVFINIKENLLQLIWKTSFLAPILAYVFFIIIFVFLWTCASKTPSGVSLWHCRCTSVICLDIK